MKRTLSNMKLMDYLTHQAVFWWILLLASAATFLQAWNEWKKQKRRDHWFSERNRKVREKWEKQRNHQ